MPVHNDGIAPDRLELRVRFACGALFGALTVGGTLLEVQVPSRAALALGTGAGALVFGLLARQFGNRFWLGLRRWFLP